MNVYGVANCSIRGWRKKSEFSLMISTADLFGSFGGSADDFFDGVATLTMVKFDLLLSCFKVCCPRTLTFLLFVVVAF